ncbi:hypothetical protein SAMN05192585_11290 [Acetanaerobacterium elongatum]|uniref:Uncharacterized protein n=1 Tax=Acetanaerobacterium elongatum TaxID=258515 RepID=A0A1G9Z5F8_9FIRM|nr:hypothetical protein SAMN05192585_11290 [Acetanaerobacterium elongatum]
MIVVDGALNTPFVCRGDLWFPAEIYLQSGVKPRANTVRPYRVPVEVCRGGHWPSVVYYAVAFRAADAQCAPLLSRRESGYRETVSPFLCRGDYQSPVDYLRPEIEPRALSMRPYVPTADLMKNRGASGTPPPTIEIIGNGSPRAP